MVSRVSWAALVCILSLSSFVYSESSHVDVKTKREEAGECMAHPQLFTFQETSGAIRSLKSKDGKNLSLAITAGVDDKEKVEKFIAELGNQLTIQDRVQKGKGIFKNAVSDISELFRTEPNIPSRASPELFNGSEIQFILFADTRAKYKPELSKGWEEFQRIKAQAEAKGRAEGAKVGYETIVNGGFFKRAGNFLSFGALGSIATGMGERKGAQQGGRIAEVVGPPTVVFKAEEEILKQLEELEKYVQDYQKSLSTGGKGPSISFSTLVDGSDFSKNIRTRDKGTLDWANGFLEADQKLDADKASTVHDNFLQKMNEADLVLKQVFKSDKAGFKLSIISPGGRVLESFDVRKTTPQKIASRYYAHKRNCVKE